MKKHFYKLAIGLLGVCSTLSGNAQTSCDSVSIHSSYGVSGSYPEYIQCEKFGEYALDTYKSSNSPLFLQWVTKTGTLLQQGSAFFSDTTGEFLLQIEGNGCFVERPFTIIDAPETILFSDKVSYCQNETKPTLSAEVFFLGNPPNFPTEYAVFKDNQPFVYFTNFTTLPDVSSGIYEIRNASQQCWNSNLNQTLTITEEQCTPKLCEPIKDSVYQTVFDGEIHKSCDLAGWDLTYPEGKRPEGVEIVWKRNGDEIQTNNIALSIDVVATNIPDSYMVETSSSGCTWEKEIFIMKDSINTAITTSDPNYSHCDNAPITITANGNEHLSGETYTWEKKNNSGAYIPHGTGTVLPNPQIGDYRIYVETEQGCFSTPTSFTINDGNCPQECPELIVEKIQLNNPLFPIPPLNQNYFTLCENNELILDAKTLINGIPTIRTGSITWYEVSGSSPQNMGGNPFFVYTPGLYIANYVDQANCNVNSDTIIVELSWPVDLKIIPMDGTTELEVINDAITICEGSNLSLVPDAFYHSYYKWEKDAAFISNEVMIDVDQAGYYTLLVYDYNGCWQDAYLNVNINQNPNCIITSIDDALGTQIELAPNPTSNNLTLVGGKDITSVQVISQLGISSTESVTNGTIDMSDYQSGVYTILIERNGNIETHRIVKQ